MPMQKTQRVTERGTEMGLCVVSRARQINSSVFQKTVTSISLTANRVRWEDPKTQCLFFLWLMRHTGKCAQSRPSEICEKNFFFFYCCRGSLQIRVCKHSRAIFRLFCPDSEKDSILTVLFTRWMPTKHAVYVACIRFWIQPLHLLCPGCTITATDLCGCLWPCKV